MEPTKASEPAVVLSLSFMAMLSLSSRGISCSPPLGQIRRSRLALRAWWMASGLTSMTDRVEPTDPGKVELGELPGGDPVLSKGELEVADGCLNEAQRVRSSNSWLGGCRWCNEHKKNEERGDEKEFSGSHSRVEIDHEGAQPSVSLMYKGLIK
ncbi:hypothetical protein CRG98_026735 [Punica granatum]|uniref:Uncharacterized protein n=1 Tax=Punica granatum TaxID=22663 RepID=A0A2I0J9I8_PUNGR|nr:hypothetical protein CRG98_026735 [Punica granatum]